MARLTQTEIINKLVESTGLEMLKICAIFGALAALEITENQLLSIVHSFEGNQLSSKQGYGVKIHSGIGDMENIPCLTLKEARIALNMTQDELAGVFGVNRNTLARWERGVSPPDAPGMLSLALEALVTQKQLTDPDFLSRKERTKRSIHDSLIELRQRVKHRKVESVN